MLGKHLVFFYNPRIVFLWYHTFKPPAPDFIMPRGRPRKPRNTNTDSTSIISCIQRPSDGPVHTPTHVLTRPPRFQDTTDWNHLPPFEPSNTFTPVIVTVRQEISSSSHLTFVLDHSSTTSSTTTTHHGSSVE